MPNATPELIYEIVKNDPSLRNILEGRIIAEASKPSVKWGQPEQVVPQATAPQQGATQSQNPMDVIENFVKELERRFNQIDQAMEIINKNISTLAGNVKDDFQLTHDELDRLSKTHSSK